MEGGRPRQDACSWHTSFLSPWWACTRVLLQDLRESMDGFLPGSTLAEEGVHFHPSENFFMDPCRQAGRQAGGSGEDQGAMREDMELGSPADDGPLLCD